MTERYRPQGHTYNVLCPGPSAPYVRAEDLLDGPLIAINAAIATTLPVWCWAMTDNPYNLHREYPEAYERRDLWFFTIDCWLWHWQRLGIDVTRCFAAEAIQIAIPDGRGGVEFIIDRKGQRGGVPTIVKVLGWLCTWLKAREIRVLGADMQGKGSPWTPYCTWRPDAKEDSDRWEMERFMFGRAVEAGARLGCTIYRHEITHAEVAA